MRRGLPALAAFLLLTGGSSASGGETGREGGRIPGFSAAASAEQRRLEARLVELLDPASTARHFRLLTEEPHPAGSERNFELARYVRDRFAAYGLEDVTLHRYDVLLPWPRKVEVTMVEPVEWRASLREDAYPVDKDSYAVGAELTYLGMSASGSVTADVIYAHSGNPEDYDWLEAQGIDPRGKIAIVRYSMPYSYRGFKAWEAQRRGVAALIIYSDPKDDGYRQGEVFPDGPWGPESHIQRGAITYDFIVPGDPLTPGWASVEGARRIAAADSRSVPRIPAVPLSWRDAKPILENLRGPVAPLEWHGALPMTYRVGPGPAKVHVEIDMDGETRPIWVVEGRIRGSENPDELVVLGNHRDAWVYGAVDPSSGSATLLETARVLGELVKSGQRPRRTVVFASWDAEEWHLTGSTEWGEQFADELGNGAVAYVNVDSSASGSEFQPDAVGSLAPLVVELAQEFQDPASGKSLGDALRAARTKARQEEGEQGPLTDDDLVDVRIGSGSDHTVFLNFLGVPVADLTFDGPYGVYHSQYDDLYWMERFGDPGCRYMTAMTEVWSRLALRLANAEIHPYDFVQYAAAVDGFLDGLAELPGSASELDLGAARAAVERWRSAAGTVRQQVESILATGEPAEAEVLAELNRTLLSVERQLLLAQGIPGRPWFRHALYAPRYTYAAMSLPGVREAAEAGDWDLAREQLGVLAGRLNAAAAATEAAVNTVKGP